MSITPDHLRIKYEGTEFDLSIDKSNLNKEECINITNLPGVKNKWDITILNDLRRLFYTAVKSGLKQGVSSEVIEKGLRAINAVQVSAPPTKTEKAAHDISAKGTIKSLIAQFSSITNSPPTSIKSSIGSKTPSINPTDKEIIQICDSIKGKTFDSYDLSDKFHILDSGYTESPKGICTLQYFVDNSLEYIHNSVASIQASVLKLADYFVFARIKESIVRPTPKEYVDIKFIDYKIDDYILMKKSSDGNVQYYDQKTKSFQTLTDEDLVQFNIKPEDLCIQLSAELPELPARYSQPTLTSSLQSTTGVQKGRFYHEGQSDDGKYSSLCGFHAANAFVGTRVCSLKDFVSRIVEVKKKNEGYDIPTAQRIGSDISPLSGNNPDTLRGFLVGLANDGKIDPKFKNIELAHFDKIEKKDNRIIVSSNAKHLVDVRQKEWQILLKSFNDPACDRVIVGYGGSHFVTFRKTDQGRWHVIDSMTNSQNKVDDQSKVQDYTSVEECLLHYPHRTPNGSMTFMFIKPSAGQNSSEVEKKVKADFNKPKAVPSADKKSPSNTSSNANDSSAK